MSNGHNLIAVTNSDTPDHTDIHRFLATQTIAESIRIAEGLGADAVFQDWEIISGVGYKYVARSYASSGGFTDSAASATFVNNLDGLWLSLIARDDPTTNAELALNLMITAPPQKNVAPKSVSHEFKGRPRPVTYFGQSTIKRLDYPITIQNANIGDLAILKALEEADDTLCIRDNFGNKMYGRMINLPVVDDIGAASFTLSFVNEAFTEGV